MALDTSQLYNIWMINHYAGNPYLGMEYRHYYLAKHILKSGHKPCIISASFHHLYSKKPCIESKINFKYVDGILYVLIKTPPYKGNGINRLINMMVFTRRLNLYSKEIIKEIGKPSIILVSSPHPFIVNNLLFFKKELGIPIIYEVRDPWPLMLNELNSLSKLNPLSIWFSHLQKKAFAVSDKVISLWKTADRYMFEKGLNPEKYAYLPNGIELLKKDEKNNKFLDHPLVGDVKKLKTNKKIIIGYAGSLGYANPLDTIVNACSILKSKNEKNIVFYLVGDGPEKDRIINDAKLKGLNNIKFHERCIFSYKTLVKKQFKRKNDSLAKAKYNS